MTATRSTVSRASAGWRDHQVPVLVMFSVRTLRFGSDIGKSLSHLLKARTANVGGMCSVSQGLTVAGPTKGMRGRMMVVVVGLWSCSVGPFEAGLDANGPVLGGVAVSPRSSPVH